MDAEFLDRPGNEGVSARYANYFEIGHNAAEFILDFGQAFAEAEDREIHTRIVMSPIYAKSFHSLLQKAIERYEQMYGQVSEGKPE